MAAAAAQAADEVVLAPVGPLTRHPVIVEHTLDELEGLGVDERRVLAVVLHPAPGDVAEVVAVAQNLVQLVGGHRPGWRPRSRPVGQSTCLQLVGEGAQRPVAAGVGHEGPGHELRPLRIDLNGAGLVAVDELADVAVADRCSGRCAAGPHLLLGALDDLSGQVARVELGD
ncbi:MAG: hypothetical protein M3P93_03245 [Actinomycetota bacterium]|nr:hypothetical protein [Actinomycetota bacterium]